VNLRLLKLCLGAVFFISLASLGAIVVFINPFRADKTGLILFSVVLFLAIFSASSGLGLWFRKSFVSRNNLNRILKMVFRQSALISLLIGSVLWLNHFKILKWWSGLAVLLLILGLEYYFLTRHQSTNAHE
jgi:hypothetical protein